MPATAPLMPSQPSLASRALVPGVLLLIAVALAAVSLMQSAPGVRVAQAPADFLTDVTALNPGDLRDANLVFHGDAYRVGATQDGAAVEPGTEFPEGVAPVALDLSFNEPLPGTILSADLLDVYYFDGTSWSPLGLTADQGTFHVSADRVGDYAIAAPALRVVVSPSSATLRRGETVQFTATVRDPDGQEVEGHQVRWQATTAAGTITAQGLFRATGIPGDYPGAVVASVGGLQGSADIHIVPWRTALPMVARNWEAQRSPNDPLFAFQWNLKQVRAPHAWSATTGGTAIVAVIDSGADLAHPDLQANLVPGRNFVSTGLPPEDDNGHGTHVAGIIGAVGNNGLGLSGVSWTARIMPLKVLKADGAGSISNAAAAVYWAVDNGAKVINLSLGTKYHFKPLEDAISYAISRGVVVVAASGNVGQSDITMGAPVYPAAYPGVIGVGSTDAQDRITPTSNQGPFVDVTAPGDRVWSTVPGGRYSQMSGTSMATPHVAGLAALILARYPQLTGTQVAAIINASATDLGAPGYDTTFGYGRIDAGAALSRGPGLLAAGVATTEEAVPAIKPEVQVAPAEAGWYQPGVLLVKASAEALALAQQSLPAATIQSMDVDTGIPGMVRLYVPEGMEAQLLEQLSQVPGIEEVYFDAYVFAID
jgi:subtilisin family serine protease